MPFEGDTNWSGYISHKVGTDGAPIRTITPRVNQTLYKCGHECFSFYLATGCKYLYIGKSSFDIYYPLLLSSIKLNWSYMCPTLSLHLKDNKL